MYLKLWIEGEEEGLSCAIKAIADFKGLRCQCTEHLEKQRNKAEQQLIPCCDSVPTYYRIESMPVESAAYLAIAVLNNHEHWGVLALHGSVQRLNAHAML